MKIEWHSQTAGPMTLEKALEYCENLGFGWRAPTTYDMANSILADNSFYKSSSGYWTKTTLDQKSCFVYWNKKDNCAVEKRTDNKNLKKYIRAVRDIAQPEYKDYPSDFVDLGDESDSDDFFDMSKEKIAACQAFEDRLKKPYPNNENKCAGKGPDVGIKHDTGKARYDLFPWDLMEGVVAVYTHGAAEYDDNNWRKGFAWGRIIGAVFRHLVAWINGTDLDLKTGLHNLDQAIWNLFCLRGMQAEGSGTDDRWVTLREKEGKNL